MCSSPVATGSIAFTALTSIARFGGTSSAQLGLVLIGGIEDVRYVVEVCELVAGIRRVEQVDGNMADFARCFSTAPRQADNLPVSEFNEVRDQIAADNAIGSNNHCFPGHSKISGFNFRNQR